jgi:hypothetical protein
VRIREEETSKTTFKKRYGHYEFVVVPFGLTNAPTTLMYIMNGVFRDYLEKSLLFYWMIFLSSPRKRRSMNII